MKFSEILKSINSQLDSLITKDTPTEQISQIGKVKEQLNDLDESHKQTLVDYGALKDRYIEAVKNYGTSKQPTTEDVDENREVTFEEIGREILAKDNK